MDMRQGWRKYLGVIAMACALWTESARAETGETARYRVMVGQIVAGTSGVDLTAFSCAADGVPCSGKISGKEREITVRVVLKDDTASLGFVMEGKVLLTGQEGEEMFQTGLDNPRLELVQLYWSHPDAARDRVDGLRLSPVWRQGQGEAARVAVILIPE